MISGIFAALFPACKRPSRVAVIGQGLVLEHRITPGDFSGATASPPYILPSELDKEANGWDVPTEPAGNWDPLIPTDEEVAPVTPINLEDYVPIIPVVDPNSGWDSPTDGGDDWGTSADRIAEMTREMDRKIQEMAATIEVIRPDWDMPTEPAGSW